METAEQLLYRALERLTKATRASSAGRRQGLGHEVQAALRQADRALEETAVGNVACDCAVPDIVRRIEAHLGESADRLCAYCGKEIR